MGKKKNVKKVLLFIVEGKSDEKALTAILESLFSPMHFHTIVAKGDITAQYHPNRNTNIVNKVKDFANNNLDVFTPSDLATICLLTDLDGCFIPDSQVTSHEKKKNVYSRERIYAQNVEHQIETKNFKARNLKILSTRKYLTIRSIKIPFVCYYMSCNLEDVFQGEQNYPDSEKSALADQIADTYQRDIEGFVHFLNTQYPLSEQDYSLSWQYPQLENHSLERHTNFLIFLLDHKNYLSEEALKICNELQTEKELSEE
ncbi:MAG: hypothetical protein K2H85_09515 [Allobaculum sp.]|nr:hypothetical protein [Allobaculum sp.]